MKAIESKKDVEVLLKEFGTRLRALEKTREDHVKKWQKEYTENCETGKNPNCNIDFTNERSKLNQKNNTLHYIIQSLERLLEWFDLVEIIKIEHPFIENEDRSMRHVIEFEKINNDILKLSEKIAEKTEEVY